MWQLVINTGTTIVTFLMVFLIQNTQIRDTEAIQVKLYELIRATRATKGALDAFRTKYELPAATAREGLSRGAKGAWYIKAINRHYSKEKGLDH